MPITYEPIATNTLGSNQTTVTFTSIPGTYTDLVLIFNGTTTVDADKRMRFNSDTGTNYSDTALYGNGTSAISGRDSSASQIYIDFSGTGGTGQHTNIINIMNYANTTTYKTCLVRTSKTGFAALALVGLWRSTAAITSLEIFVGANNISSGSTFTLYGIKAA